MSLIKLCTYLTSIIYVYGNKNYSTNIYSMFILLETHPFKSTQVPKVHKYTTCSSRHLQIARRGTKVLFTYT